MLLPLVIVGIVFALRIKRMKRGRPLSRVRSAIVGMLLVGVIAFVFNSQPPSALGWALFAAGLSLGAVLGILRAQMMRVERDSESGKVLIHQTPAGLILLAAVMIARRLIGPAPVGQPGSHTVSLLTDGLLGFAFGLMMATQLWLWLRVHKTA
jgi:hypothetical protein